MPDALSRSVPVVEVWEAEVDKPVIKDRWYLNMVGKVRSNPLRYSNWRLQGAYLYKYVKLEYTDLRRPEECWKRVVPKDERRVVISAAHDPPSSGHLGVYKTYSRITEKYVWPKMRQDVAEYVRRCVVCAAHKSDLAVPTNKIATHEKPSRPWELISTDLMGPLPRSSKGFAYILVATDYLSKFSLVFALRSATAAAVVKRIEEDVFLLFGVPRLIICDNGPQYRSREFQNLANSYRVKVQYTAYYNPRANLMERVNRSLKTMLATYVGENHKKWDVNLQAIACALRTARHETICLLLYFVNFGRDMVLKGDEYGLGYEEIRKSRDQYHRKRRRLSSCLKRLGKD